MRQYSHNKKHNWEGASIVKENMSIKREPLITEIKYEYWERVSNYGH